MFVCCFAACLFVFFFNATATTEIYTLSLHDALPIFDIEFNRFVAARTDYGARTERLIQVQRRLEEERFQILELQSITEDVDLAEAITDLQLRQTALQATLAVAANILPRSLMDLLF